MICYKNKKCLISVVIISLILVFFTDLPWRIVQQFSAVGVSMSVTTNPFNSTASQLREKEVELEQRQAYIDARELEIKKEKRSSDMINFRMGLAFLVLLIIFARHLYYDRK